jgi:hypothetical protein
MKCPDNYLPLVLPTAGFDPGPLGRKGGALHHALAPYK